MQKASLDRIFTLSMIQLTAECFSNRSRSVVFRILALVDKGCLQDARGALDTHLMVTIPVRLGSRHFIGNNKEERTSSALVYCHLVVTKKSTTRGKRARAVAEHVSPRLSAHMCRV